MKPSFALLTLCAFIWLGVNLLAQEMPSPEPVQPAQTQSTPSDKEASPGSPAGQSADTSASGPSARSFKGRIEQSGDKLILSNSESQTAYQLDDQKKAKRYQGRDIKVIGTLDSTTNTVHVIEIAPIGNP